MAIAKTTSRPWWNGPVTRLGKKRLPTRIAAFAGFRLPSTWRPRISWIGLNPRNAANSVPTGGSPATWWATRAGTPCPVSPENSAAGMSWASPAMSVEKKTPIDSAIPEFCSVIIIPLPAPRAPGGRLFMTPVMFGLTNSPDPRPLTNRISANCQ